MSAPEVDYRLVRRLRRSVADNLAGEISRLQANRPAPLRNEDQRMLARSLVAAEVGDHVSALVHQGATAPSAGHEEALARAVFDALFGLGRLQPLVEDPLVENIDVNGCDDVWVSYSDGRSERVAPVADSDEELVETVQNFAAYLGQSTREFSSARPLLNLRLPDGSRLAAWMALTPRPGLTIRRHRLVDITLDDLLELGTVDLAVHAFLRAAVRARKNIVVTGGMNAAKTTLIRALANEIDYADKLVVVEKEYELALDRLPGRHRQVVSMEAREANSEGSGEVPLAALVVHALRMNPRRILVGEVRGDELIPMLTAMSTGNPGSLCTLHANSARAAFTRMAAIGLSAARPLTVDAVYALAADALDFVVHIDLADDTAIGGGRRRHVASMLEVLEVGEGGRVSLNEVFCPGADGRAVPGTTPRALPDLVRVGFDPAYLDRRDGWWHSSVNPTGPGLALLPGGAP